MSLPFTSQVEATTLNMLETGSEDNVYDSASLWYHLRETGQITYSGGSEIQSSIMYQKIAAAGSFQGADVLSISPTDTDTAVKLAWKLYYGSVVLTEHDILRNSGDEARVDLIQTKTKNCDLKLADLLSTDLFSTNADSATGITGLRNVASTSTTLHNIPVADFSGWVADVDAATSTVSLSALEQGQLDATIASDGPDMGVTNKAVYKKVWALLQANQRFGGEQTARGGFKYIMLNDIPIFHDSHSPGSGAGSATNWLWWLNSRHMNLIVHKDVNFKVERVPRPATQWIRIWQKFFAGNVIFRNRRTVSAFSVLKP